ncbi:MAG TPA: hypothetical protein VLA58_05590 [Chitinophagaceae bacterium]|nr:hypothetical protein [Chitinophagaceae bacterium]
MNNIFWNGYSSSERHYTITKVREVVSSYGDIVDFKFFSDISMVIMIEIKECYIDKLNDELKRHLLLDEFDSLQSKSESERVIYLNLTFTQATGDLKVEVPSVPG